MELDPKLWPHPAAKGLPRFGICAHSQYCIAEGKSGLQFASLSTRNGGAKYFWKPLSGLTAKVALSALETYGSVDGLWAGESRLPIKDIFEPDKVMQVKKVFIRLVGPQVYASFAETVAAPAAAAAAAGPEVKREAEPEAKPEAEANAKTANVGMEERTSVVGQKRKARMEMVDALKAEQEALAKSQRATSAIEADVVD